VRALIEAHRSSEAYDAAAEALKSAPQTAGMFSARGRAFFRQGDLTKAETSFQRALLIDPKFPYALAGLATILGGLGKHKTAETLVTQAYKAGPDDPEIIRQWANTLKGGAHVEALRRAVAILDPETTEAKQLRAHIATDVALGDRHPRVLASEYRNYEIGLAEILNGPRIQRGIGLRVRFNGSYSATLLLDTGASGIDLSPKAVAKAGLEPLGEEGVEAQGIGDRKAATSLRHLAREVRIGDLVLRDCPVSVFDGVRDADADGLIGADVFSKFLVQIDWPLLKLRLQPYPGMKAPPGDEASDAEAQLPSGWQRIFYNGHLLIPTSVNGEPARFFMIDSGASANLIAIDAARSSTKVHGDSNIVVRGIQGKVKDVSRADKVQLQFANFRQDNADIVAMDLSRISDLGGIEVGGLLGKPVLRQLVLTIDYRSAAIRLEH